MPFTATGSEGKVRSQLDQCATASFSDALSDSLCLPHCAGAALVVPAQPNDSSWVISHQFWVSSIDLKPSHARYDEPSSSQSICTYRRNHQYSPHSWTQPTKQFEWPNCDLRQPHVKSESLQRSTTSAFHYVEEACPSQPQASTPSLEAQKNPSLVQAISSPRRPAGAERRVNIR